MTDDCRFCGINNRHLVLTILEAEKSKIKVLSDLVPASFVAVVVT